jgi:hypothetical protein
MNDPTDLAIGELAQQIATRIPDGDGILTIQTWRDEQWIRGDKIGLLTLAAAILLLVTSGESAYKPMETRIQRRVPGRYRSSIRIRPVQDLSEIANLRRGERPSFWMCVSMVSATALLAGLACVGRYAIATWVFWLQL